VGRAGWIVAIVFAFLYAYDLWGGISNLVGVASDFAASGIPVTGEIWLLLIGYAVAPMVVYAAALVVGLRLPTWAKAIVFVVGLALTSVISLDLLAVA
jgi:hypothetical protein